MVENKTIVVFGATGGIGSAVVSALKCQHNRLSLASRGVEEVTKGTVLSRRTDVTNYEQVCRHLDITRKTFGQIDAVVNCVGVPLACKVSRITEQDLRKIFEINFFGAVHVLKASWLYLETGASIVTIGSLRSFEDGASKAAYCSSKAALEMFIRCMRLEIRDDIRLILIHPGFVNTDWYGTESKKPYQKQGENSDRLIPVDVVQPQDVASVVEFVLGLSESAKVYDIRMGEVLGERSDVCFL